MSFKVYLSEFKNTFDKKPVTSSLASIIDKIRSSSHLKDLCAQLLSLPSDKVRASFKQKNFPAITVSGQFENGHAAKDLIQHSGLLQIDIDHVSTSALKNVQNARKLLAADPYTCVAFVSPSQNGIKLFVKIDPTKHLEGFEGLQIYYQKVYEVTIDSHCKDIGRLCYLSYDPQPVFNENSKQFEPNDTQTKKNHSPKSISNSNNLLDDIEILTKIIEARQIDITIEYSDWLKLGFALSSSLRETGRSYFHRLSKFNQEYDPKITDKQFSICLKSANGSISTHSIFYLAKKFGIDLKSLKHFKEPLSLNSKKKIVFYDPGFKNGRVSDVLINYTKLKELLLSFGFRRLDIGDDFILVKLKENVAEKINPNYIQDYFFKYLESLPEDLGRGIKKVMIVEKFNRSPDTYFSKKRYSLLPPIDPTKFVFDSKDKCFIFYKNGFVECNKEGRLFKSYDQLPGYIWKNQILSRNFNYFSINESFEEGQGDFARFIFNICNRNETRFSSLRSLLGYCLHGYFEGKLKAFVLTDSRISDNPDGRTGKSLIGVALGKIKKVCNVNGKDFESTYQFKYQEADIDDQIVVIDDVKNNFNIETLFNDITEGLQVNKKNQKPFVIRAKMIVTTNRTIKIEGASAKDRTIEFELADYYNETLSPLDEFQKWFFTEFTEDDWCKFDNFMLNNISFYLKQGILKPEVINLDKRKLLETTNSDFVEFMNAKLSIGEIVAGGEYCKQDLHNEFLAQYPEYHGDKRFSKPRNFRDCLVLFTRYTPGFAVFRKEDERKSGTKRYIRFRKEVPLNF